MPPKKRGNQVEAVAATEENGTELPSNSSPNKKRKGNKDTEDGANEAQIFENGDNSVEQKMKKNKKGGAKESTSESDLAGSPPKKSKKALTTKNKEKGEPSRQLPPRNAKTGGNLSEETLAKNIEGEVLTKKKKTKKPAVNEENQAPKKGKKPKKAPAKPKSSPTKKSPKKKIVAKPKKTTAIEEVA